MSFETAADTEKRVERPAAPLQTESFRSSRPQLVGPDSPEPPFPIALAGCVQRGFGRGGKDLGCPTGSYSLHVLVDCPCLMLTYRSKPS
jgi:riboflavin kinase